MPRPLRSGPAPRKALGQHFLRDTGVLQDLVDALNVPEGALVLEIGAGTGQLTEFLLAKGFDVLALEVEERLVRHLEGRFRDSNRLRIVPGDARIIEVERLIAAGQSYVAVGNLPYFAANPIIRHFLETRH
jgi:16S rRNA (adenine1518-N6/adenine1519-N6)-dimethyltransferase